MKRGPAVRSGTGCRSGIVKSACWVSWAEDPLLGCSDGSIRGLNRLCNTGEPQILTELDFDIDNLTSCGESLIASGFGHSVVLDKSLKTIRRFDRKNGEPHDISFLRGLGFVVSEWSPCRKLVLLDSACHQRLEIPVEPELPRSVFYTPIGPALVAGKGGQWEVLYTSWEKGA